MSPREPMGGFEDGDERPLAAEFVLGLVQGEEREALERRRRDDYVFAQEVEFWEAKLGPIANEAAAVEPPPHVWEAIAAEVGHKPVPLAAFSVAEEPRSGLWNSLAFWRGLGIVTSGLAAACLALLLLTPSAPPSSLVAALSMNDGRSGFMATVDRATGRVMLMPAMDASAPADHTHELWIIPAGGGKPVSLGTFSAKGPVTMDMPSAVMPHAAPQAALAVSVEPMGGSPTGQPTGPVVAKGMMHDI